MTILNLKRFLLALGFVLLTACAGGKTYESTGEYFDDVVITNKVRASILGDSTLKFLQISVESFRGVVQLSGFVDSTKASARAAQLARTVSGVKLVNNSLIVKEPKK
ncbi:MAG: BON domain-containing protein [Methylococcaceae bacterium]